MTDAAADASPAPEAGSKAGRKRVVAIAAAAVVAGALIVLLVLRLARPGTPAIADVILDTVPSGAAIYDDAGKMVGQTPQHLAVAGAGATVRLHLDGYEDATVRLDGAQPRPVVRLERRRLGGRTPIAGSLPASRIAPSGKTTKTAPATRPPAGPRTATDTVTAPVTTPVPPLPPLEPPVATPDKGASPTKTAGTKAVRPRSPGKKQPSLPEGQIMDPW